MVELECKRNAGEANATVNADGDELHVMHDDGGQKM